jgi:hypothetical protein
LTGSNGDGTLSATGKSGRNSDGDISKNEMMPCILIQILIQMENKHEKNSAENQQHRQPVMPDYCSHKLFNIPENDEWRR